MKRFQIVILTIMLASLSACATNSLPSSSTESSVSISVSNPQDFLSELEDILHNQRFDISCFYFFYQRLKAGTIEIHT